MKTLTITENQTAKDCGCEGDSFETLPTPNVAFGEMRNRIGESIDESAYIEAIRGEDNLEEFRSLWMEVHPEELDGDVEVASYKGYKIFLSTPNGGILGVSIEKNGQAFCCPSDVWHVQIANLLDLQGDSNETWHIEVAKRFIDLLPMQPQPQQQQQSRALPSEREVVIHMSNGKLHFTYRGKQFIPLENGSVIHGVCCYRCRVPGEPLHIQYVAMPGIDIIIRDELYEGLLSLYLETNLAGQALLAKYERCQQQQTTLLQN